MGDPFRARPKPSRDQPSGEVSEFPGEAPRADGEPSRAELKDMRKADLVALAKTRGLDTTGTHAQLVERLAT